MHVDYAFLNVRFFLWFDTIAVFEAGKSLKDLYTTQVLQNSQSHYDFKKNKIRDRGLLGSVSTSPRGTTVLEQLLYSYDLALFLS